MLSLGHGAAQGRDGDWLRRLRRRPAPTPSMLAVGRTTSAAVRGSHADDAAQRRQCCLLCRHAEEVDRRARDAVRSCSRRADLTCPWPSCAPVAEGDRARQLDPAVLVLSPRRPRRPSLVLDLERNRTACRTRADPRRLAAAAHGAEPRAAPRRRLRRRRWPDRQRPPASSPASVSGAEAGGGPKNEYAIRRARPPPAKTRPQSNGPRGTIQSRR